MGSEPKFLNFFFLFLFQPNESCSYRELIKDSSSWSSKKKKEAIVEAWRPKPVGFRALSIPFSKSQDVVVKEDLVIFLPPPATYRAARSNGTPIPSRALAVPKAIQIEKRGPEAADEAGMARMMMTFFFRRHRPKSVEFFFLFSQINKRPSAGST